MNDPRTMTQMFLIRAARPKSGHRLDCFIEAENESDAYYRHRMHFGALDSQPDYPQWQDVEIVEIPDLTGEPRVYDGFEFN